MMRDRCRIERCAPPRRRAIVCGIGAVLTVSLCPIDRALAQDADLSTLLQRDTPPDEIVVYGRALAQIGTATSGSQGVVGYKDFEDRPLSRVGELVENVPGVVATQHSGRR